MHDQNDFEKAYHDSSLLSTEDSRDEEKKRLPTFMEFSADLGLHGYLQVGKEKGIRKVIWCVLFIGAIGMSAIMFYDTVIAYFEYQTYLEVKPFKFPDNDIVFPTVTVCNKIPLIKSGYERVKKIINITEKEFEDFHNRYFSRYRKRIKPFNVTFEKKIVDALLKHNITTTEQAFELFEINNEDMFSHPVAKLFLKTMDGNPDYPTCRFDYRRKCTTAGMLSQRESLCHQINYVQPGVPGVPQKGWIARWNKFSNLIFVVNIATTERHRKTNKVRISAPYMDLVDGLVVYINSYGDVMDNSHQTERIFLRPGFWHFLKLDFTEINHLPPPFPFGCGKRSLTWIKPVFKYTYGLCLLDCILDIKYKKCGCVGWEFGNLVDLPICNITQAWCFINVKYKYLRQCRKIRECPSDCVHYRYNVNVETIDIRDDSVVDRTLMLPNWKLNRSETHEFIRKNLVGVQLLFSPHAFIENHNPAITGNSFFGTVGGTLGLCVGFNILIVFEFIQYVIDYIALRIKKTR